MSELNSEWTYFVISVLVHRYIVVSSNPHNLYVELSLELLDQEIVELECILHYFFYLAHHLSLLLTQEVQ